MPTGRIRREIHALRTSAPGTRFEAGHERHRIRNQPLRILVMGVGLTLMGAGAITFWLPGPQSIIVIAGLVLIAGQWRRLARRLDRMELAWRRWHAARWEPYTHKRPVLVVAWLAFVGLVAAAAYASWQLGLLPGV